LLGFRFTNQFVKDVKLVEKRRYYMDDLFDILIKIIWKETLPDHCREHELSGNYSGFTECHVKNDWILIYYFCDEGVVFSRTGTHSDLF
jgi:mRNA interferase YafQ